MKLSATDEIQAFRRDSSNEQHSRSHIKARDRTPSNKSCILQFHSNIVNHLSVFLINQYKISEMRAHLQINVQSQAKIPVVNPTLCSSSP